MQSERYEVRAEPEVSRDLEEVAAVDEQLVDVAIALMGKLRHDPWLGEDLWERYNMPALKRCRKLRFDLPGWPRKPRYRIVYRNDPSDGAPGLVRLWAVGPRAKMVAYARANARIAREEVGKRRRRRGE